VLQLQRHASHDSYKSTRRATIDCCRPPRKKSTRCSLWPSTTLTEFRVIARYIPLGDATNQSIDQSGLSVISYLEFTSDIEWMNEWVSEWVSEWMNEWMIEWMSEWMNEWMNEWANYSKWSFCHSNEFIWGNRGLYKVKQDAGTNAAFHWTRELVITRW